MKKILISAEELLVDSFELGAKVLESGFRPTHIVAIWRGGAPVGIALQEAMAYCGIETDHIAIRTSSYVGQTQSKHVAIHGLNYLIKNICHDDRLLIVDDVFDSGRTIDAVINEIADKARGNNPSDVRVAVPWYKPERNCTSRTPDFFLKETDDWLVFPHELDALGDEELQKQRPRLFELRQQAK